jgi:hypothetical protein
VRVVSRLVGDPKPNITKARVCLVEDPHPARAWAALASGSKSFLFQFPADSEFHQESASLGARIITPDRTPLAWGDREREVLLNFWDDTARLHVRETAGFGIWYSRTIGAGVITAIADNSDDR